MYIYIVRYTKRHLKKYLYCLGEVQRIFSETQIISMYITLAVVVAVWRSQVPMPQLVMWLLTISDRLCCRRGDGRK